jgi:hypothetical protein
VRSAPSINGTLWRRATGGDVPLWRGSVQCDVNVVAFADLPVGNAQQTK